MPRSRDQGIVLVVVLVLDLLGSAPIKEPAARKAPPPLGPKKAVPIFQVPAQWLISNETWFREFNADTRLTPISILLPIP
jgi:hypothetical protein